MTHPLPQQFQDKLLELGEDRRHEVISGHEFTRWLYHHPVFGDSYVFTYPSGNWIEIACHSPDTCFADVYWHTRDAT